MGSTKVSKYPFTREKSSFSTKLLVGIVHLSLVSIELATLISGNIPVSFQLMVVVLCCIVLGSFQSLIDPNDVEASEVERLQPQDAYMFPVKGSAVLLIGYFLIKKCPEWTINLVIRLLFILIGTLAVQTYFDSLLSIFAPSFLKPVLEKQFGKIVIKDTKLFNLIPLISISWIPGSDNNNNNNINENNNSNNNNDNKKSSSSSSSQEVVLTISNILSLIIGFIFSILWFKYEHYLLNNIIGISLSIQAIAFINPGSYYTATILLAILFFYDIFWVFGTDVMVTVAKGINAPIKLYFPRPDVMEKKSMLGLGDIVLPGIYIALLLRFDIMKNYFDNNSSNNNKLTSHNKIYFYISIIGYSIGMLTCLFIMYQFEHAQPALLYLVPGVILPIIILSFLKGEFTMLWNFKEEGKDKDKGKKQE